MKTKTETSRINPVELRDGDVVFFTCPGRLTYNTQVSLEKEIYEAIGDKIGESGKIIILEDGVCVDGVFRGER